MQVYQTEVVSIGSEAKLFLEEKMLVLFGENAPAELADYTYHIIVNSVYSDIVPGMELVIDDNNYKITAVGNIVKKNLEELGHIAIRFNGQTEADQAGTLYVEDKEISDVKIDSKLSIR